MSEGTKKYPSKMDSGIKSLLELLPGIDDFLIDTLSKEKLSASTEKKRLYYVERLDVLRLPPTLPPRPDGLTKNGHSSSQPNINASADDFIAQQRELSQQQHQDGNGEEYDTVESPTPLAGVLEKFGLTEGERNGREDDLYEVPVGQHPSAFSDGDYSSGTDYESYSDDDEAPVYQNEEFHETKTKSSSMPVLTWPRTRGKSRGKSKRKKEKRNGEKVPEYETVCAKDYPNASYAGELYQKWKLGKWMKRYCILDSSGGFLCFKNDRETKPVHQVGNFEVAYIGKEGKRNYVMKMTTAMGEPLFFSSENKDKMEKWMRALHPGFPGIDQTELIQGAEEGGKSTSNTNLSLSSSEGGSGDGVVHHGNQGSPLMQQTSQDKNKKKNGPSMMDSISSFFSMGRKKGDKTKRDMSMVDIEEKELDPEALVGGTINISSELFNHRRWLVRYCIIKNGNLVCFKENSEEEEFTLPLHGLEIDSSRDTKRQLAVRLSQDARERVLLDFADAMQQGAWLSVLVKEIGLGDQGGVLAYQAVNDALPSPTQIDDETDIYDEPYDDKAQNGNGLARGRPGSDSLRSTSSNASNSSASGNATDGSKIPPPLPTAPPPANRERVRRSQSGRGASTTASSVTQVRRSLTNTSPRRTPSFNSQESSDTDSQSSDVIKCHQGPTIDLDKEVLETTENPILSQIRKNRTRLSFRQSDKENLLDAIGNTRKKLATLRKKRAELRAKKLHCPDLRGKKELEEQLKNLQDEYAVGEKELEELKEQLDEMENVFSSKAKSLDRGTSIPVDSSDFRRSSTLSTSSQDTDRGSPRARRSFNFKSEESSSQDADRGSPRTRRSFNYKSEESSPLNSSRTSSPSPGKTSCTVQFSAGVPTSTIAIRDYSKSSTSTGSTTRTVQESRVVVRTTTSSGSRVITKTTTSSSSSEPYKSQKIEIQGIKKDSESPRAGGRQKVQEKLKLWESLSSTSTC